MGTCYFSNRSTKGVENGILEESKIFPTKDRRHWCVLTDYIAGVNSPTLAYYQGAEGKFIENGSSELDLWEGDRETDWPTMDLEPGDSRKGRAREEDGRRNLLLTFFGVRQPWRFEPEGKWGHMTEATANQMCCFLKTIFYRDLHFTPSIHTKNPFTWKCSLFASLIFPSYHCLNVIFHGSNQWMCVSFFLLCTHTCHVLTQSPRLLFSWL